MNEEQSKLALWCKAKEIEALAKSHSNEDNVDYYHYWSGKAEGFANVWEYIVFDGRGPHPLEYNKANDEWSKKVMGEQ
jgi:hypothetical protein